MTTRLLRYCILLCLLVTGCFSPPIREEGKIDTPPPAQVFPATVTDPPAITVTPGNTDTATPVKPAATATVIRKVLPPTKTPNPYPTVVFHTALTALPPGQYLLYWTYLKYSAQLNAVSMTGEVYPLVDISGYFAENENQFEQLSANGLFLIVPYYSDVYLFHLMDQKREKLTLTDRDDCVITSISPDGKRFAGRCGALEETLTLGIRTMDKDWMILQPFEPGNEGDVYFTMAWSPDGEKLAFLYSGRNHVTEAVYVADVDACIDDPANFPEHVTGPHYEPIPYYVAWSPNSMQYAIPLSREIIVQDLKTDLFRKVKIKNEEGGPIHGIAWSPDGNWIGYCVDGSQENPGNEIGVISLVSGTTLSLAERDGCQVVGWLNIES